MAACMCVCEVYMSVCVHDVEREGNEKLTPNLSPSFRLSLYPSLLIPSFPLFLNL